MLYFNLNQQLGYKCHAEMFPFSLAEILNYVLKTPHYFSYNDFNFLMNLPS